MTSFESVALNRSASEQIVTACQKDVMSSSGAPEAQRRIQERVDVFVGQSEASSHDAVLRIWRRTYEEKASPIATEMIWEAGKNTLCRQSPAFRIAREYSVHFGVAECWNKARCSHFSLEYNRVVMQIDPIDYAAARYLFLRSQSFLHPHDPDSLIALSLATSASQDVIEKWAESMRHPIARRLRRAVRAVEENYSVLRPPKGGRRPSSSSEAGPTEASPQETAATLSLELIISDSWVKVWKDFVDAHGGQKDMALDIFPEKIDTKTIESLSLFSLSSKRAPFPSESDVRKNFFEHAKGQLEDFLSSSEGAEAVDLTAQSIGFARQWRPDCLLSRITWMHHHLAYRSLLFFLTKEVESLSSGGQQTHLYGIVSEPRIAAFLSSPILTAGLVSLSMLPASPSPMLQLQFRVEADRCQRSRP